jgi:lysophospholipase L1-like esterase
MGLAVVVVSSVVFLAVGELLMRRYLPAGYYVWPPHFTRTFDAPPGVIPGVTHPAKLTINAFGLRGDPLPDEAAYRLLTIGASTTICVYLDDSKAWPYLLQQRLNQRLGAGAVWVGNAGRPGHATPQHILQVEKLLAQHPQVDAVILFVGIADQLVDVSNTIRKSPSFASGHNDALRRAFSMYPDWDAESPWYLRNVIGRVARLRDWHPLPIQHDGVFAMDSEARFVTTIRGYRAAASRIRTSAPDLSEELAVYRRNLDAIVDRAVAAERRIIFLTQPTFWRAEMSPAEEALLWAGGPTFFHAGPGQEYYSTAVLAETMARYNDVVLEVCRDRGVECVDIASSLPKTAEVFYDDAHYTERGSAMVAERVAGYLLGSEPLRGVAR